MHTFFYQGSAWRGLQKFRCGWWGWKLVGGIILLLTVFAFLCILLCYISFRAHWVDCIVGGGVAEADSGS